MADDLHCDRPLYGIAGTCSGPSGSSGMGSSGAGGSVSGVSGDSSPGSSGTGSAGSIGGYSGPRFEVTVAVCSVGAGTAGARHRPGGQDRTAQPCGATVTTVPSSRASPATTPLIPGTSCSSGASSRFNAVTSRCPSTPTS